jgi:hypothetical protein
MGNSRISGVIAAALALAGCARFKPVEHRAEAPQAFVEVRVEADPGRVSEAVKQRLRRRGGAIDFSRFHLFPQGDPIFPELERLRTRLEGNPALARYVARPAEERSRDLYAYTILDYYWKSEYFYKGEPTLFNTDFLIHLRPDGAGTVVEVIEFIPRIWVGKSFDPMGHAGPGMYYDIRFVEPTTRDRRLLLDAIREAL